MLSLTNEWGSRQVVWSLEREGGVWEEWQTQGRGGNGRNRGEGEEGGWQNRGGESTGAQRLELLSAEPAIIHIIFHMNRSADAGGVSVQAVGALAGPPAHRHEPPAHDGARVQAPCWGAQHLAQGQAGSEHASLNLAGRPAASSAQPGGARRAAGAVAGPLPCWRRRCQAGWRAPSVDGDQKWQDYHTCHLRESQGGAAHCVGRRCACSTEGRWRRPLRMRWLGPWRQPVQ